MLTACVFGAVRGLYILHVSSHGQEEGTVHPFKASDLPAAFVSQIFPLDASADGAQVDGTHFVFPALHPALELQWAKCWNAICTSMFDAWIISVHDLKGLVYAGQGVDEGSEAPFTRPRLFEKGRPEKDEQLLPKSPEFRRRFFFLWQSLKMAMPRPAPVEEIPAFSVLIPHFNETIITTEAEVRSLPLRPLRSRHARVVRMLPCAHAVRCPNAVGAARALASPLGCCAAC